MANPIKLRLSEFLDDDLFTPRELSWLSFNARVLQEAADKSVPVIERVRYLGIFSNNSDEYFRVRVAEVRRLISVSAGDTRQQSKELLAAIQRRVVELQGEFDRIYDEVLDELALRRIYLQPKYILKTLRSARSPKELFNYLKYGTLTLKDLMMGGSAARKGDGATAIGGASASSTTSRAG